MEAPCEIRFHLRHPRRGANDLKLTSTGGPAFYYTKKLVNFWQEFSIWWVNATNMAMKSRTNTIFYTSIVSSLFTWDVRHPVAELVHHDCPFRTLKLAKVSWINPSLTLRCMSLVIVLEVKSASPQQKFAATWKLEFDTFEGENFH